MFRIECFCDDKKVGDVIRSLSGLIHGNPVVQPVANAVVANGKVKAETGGSAPELVLAWIKKNKLSSVSAVDVRKCAAEIGFSRNSYSYILKQCQAAHVLKKVGAGSNVRYEVVGAK